jgi:hypothetical protein
MCMKSILAQTLQNVNGYKQCNYGLKSIVLMHAVRYHRYAPVWIIEII